MKSLRFLDRRSGYSLASIGLLLGLVVPSVVPAFASAAQLNSRSIEMSTSAISATNVSYLLSFTPDTSTTATGGLIIDFCTESPIIGNSSCTTPTGFTVTGSAASAGTLTASGKHIKLVTTLTAATPYTVTFTNVTNPTVVGTFYARITTYTDTTAFGTYTDPSTVGSTLDQGGIALSATNAIGISASVQESMVFCVAGSTGGTTSPGPACATNTPTPSLTLGHGTPLALDTSATDTGLDYAQLSTNAASGAIVRLKNSNACGGLMRTGAAGCDIAAVGGGSATGALSAGTAYFGLKLGAPAAATGSTVATGSLVREALYSTGTDYGLGTSANADPTLDTTSTYGGKLFNSNGAPVADMNIPITFAASAAPATPAGVYRATLSLIATGTF